MVEYKQRNNRNGFNGAKGLRYLLNDADKIKKSE